MLTHIKVVALVNIFYSALGILGAIAVLFGGLFGGAFSGSLTAFVVAGITSTIIAVVIAAISIFGLIAGFGLLAHKPWARIVLIVVSALRLFRFPFGTLFGAYSLWVLLNAETKAIFAGSSYATNAGGL